MKRNKYGINFDLGVPLQSKEEFEILYVELNTDEKHRLIHWIKDKNEGPIIVYGQIGIGKTTLIEKAFQEAFVQCDIRVALDTEVLMYERGAFWGVFLGKVLKYAQQMKIDVSTYKLPEDLLQVKYEDGGLDTLINRLIEIPLEISDINYIKKVYTQIDKNIEIIKKQLQDIIKKIENKIHRKLFIFAEGIDKFNVHTAEYILILNLLDFFCQYKTLYEANLIHLLGQAEWHNHNSKKIFLAGASSERISEILNKRLGVYSKSREEMLPLLSALSGGNARQGLRLLMEYDNAVGKERKDTKEALDFACRKVRDDLLNILTGDIEPELLEVVNRDEYITPGTLLDFGSREVSQNAVYNNWIQILGEADQELKWPAVVNPLLLPAIEAFKNLPESPEIKMLRKWAEAHEISPFGLEINVSTVDKNKFFDIISSESSLVSLNIMEIFDSMAAYFLNPDRKDKIIIAYENKDLVQLANDFIIGKAGTYKPGNFKDIKYDEVHEVPLDIFLREFEREPYDGYSIFFEKKLAKKRLIALDQRRDAFIDFKMIWWIPYDDLKEYLKYWPQLREFFSIYRLEEDMLSNISKEEIEEDLEDIDLIDFSTQSKKQLKKRLRSVLNYLKTKE